MNSKGVKTGNERMIVYHYKEPDIFFVGINPHPGSFSRQVPFSNNKMFWYLLSDAGLIKEKRDVLRDDKALAKFYKEKFNAVYKLGFMNIIIKPTRDVTEIKKDEELPGRKKVYKIIKVEKPKVVCFIGKITYEKFTGSKKNSYGWKKDIDTSKVFVMHYPLRGKASIRIQELQKIKRTATRVHYLDDLNEK